MGRTRVAPWLTISLRSWSSAIKYLNFHSIGTGQDYELFDADSAGIPHALSRLPNHVLELPKNAMYRRVPSSTFPPKIHNPTV